ncbi:DDE domain-containing protein [Roseicitreum antarcticum]|uniref:DDE domain-containing protein n=1 Tax=Roseicitreum antarcticum TaxID=564137 RepID=A0A1H2Z4Q2_9RHOB|nr:DDE-type integrase/transposase/recombinase [Roseicitreum antarcticum]SDX11874.1 DDE domain-containing protein [Roseicitreum antarcticum]
MSTKQPFKRHRFPALAILCAVRICLRYPLSYQDVTDLLAERGLNVDRSTVCRWVQKFGPELSRRAGRHLSRAIDANGQLVDFRLTARRDTKAAKSFLSKAIERVRLHRPLSICTDKAPT